MESRPVATLGGLRGRRHRNPGQRYFSQFDIMADSRVVL